MTARSMPELISNGHERARDGIIVTAREQHTGRLDTFHLTGPVRRVLTEACERLDARAGEWRIVSISTPTSVFRDLQGLRGEIAASDRAEAKRVSDPGRLDLLEPLRQPGMDHGAGRLT